MMRVLHGKQFVCLCAWHGPSLLDGIFHAVLGWLVGFAMPCPPGVWIRHSRVVVACSAVMTLDANLWCIYLCCSYWGHAVVKVRVGLPVEHDAAYTGPICWRYCTINPQKRPWESVSYSLGKHAAAAQQLQATFRAAALAASSKNSSINNGSLTPRSIATKPQPHITRPHTNGGSPLRASRQGLESPTQLAASGAAAVLPARRLHASSCSNHASNLRDFPSQALKVTCNSSGHPLLQLGDSVSARCVASHCEDAQDSSSDELEPNMSVCTFDSDSEVNLIVDAMRHKQAFATADLGPPAAGTAAHAS